MATGKIFLCYRREDSAGHAGRIYDRLNRRFPGRVFMDVAGISAGTRWAEVIEQSLGSCDAAVILIGRRWLERGPAGTRRIDNPDDSLRHEITTALRLELKIVPVLVDGAAAPEHDDLPREVAPIVDWQILRIDDDEFDDDSARLVATLERQLQEEGTDSRLASASAKHSRIRRLGWIGAAAVAVILSIVLIKNSNPGPPPSPPKPPSGSGEVKPGPPPKPPVKKPEPRPDVAGEVKKPNRSETTSRKTLEKPEPRQDERAASGEAPATPQLAGEYKLDSYTLNNVPVPVTSTMSLVRINDRRFEFVISTTHPSLGTYQYRGFYARQGTNWTATYVEANDMTTPVGVAIPFKLSFDGSMLVTWSYYGKVVWRKQ